MVNWTSFANLPGSVENNFETLCRSLVFLHYARHGRFAALANQPGVEFHLRLQSDCSLGRAGQWFGWQCRWYDLQSRRAIGNSRRKKIEEAIRKTERELPDLTDWILWTRHTLTKADQGWFYSLTTRMRLALWTADNVETLLSGDAEIFRQTYFGELVLTPSSLQHRHELSTAQIRERWLPQVHQVVDAERILRRILGEAESWDELTLVATQLRSAAAAIRSERAAWTGRFSSTLPDFVDTIEGFAVLLNDVQRALKDGDFELMRHLLDSRPQSPGTGIRTIPTRLRAAHFVCGLNATNAVADFSRGVRLLKQAQDYLATSLVGIVADAGGGKTQLSAQLTAFTADRPAGILLFGRELHSGRTLDDLAKGVILNGAPVPTMEALVAALDAAGQRAKRRLPLVIDGLNEAEDPRDWKDKLAALNILLRRFANVLVVCTVRTGARRVSEERWPQLPVEETAARPSFAKDALPDDVRQIEIPDFGEDTLSAIRRYFTYFRIVPGDAELPMELFSHPLTLRIYCEVTNRERTHDVIIEAFPGSLTSLFEAYVDKATERIAYLSPRHHRYFQQDIRAALDVLGIEFWERSARAIPTSELRRAIHDESRPWNESLVHMLEQEGVILRVPTPAPTNEYVIPVYDALGGYIVANSVLTKLGRTNFETWLRERQTLEKLNGDATNCHPLALDIFRALVGLVPRRLYRQQVWQLVDEPLKSVALRMAASLEGQYLDAGTVDGIAQFLRRGEPRSQRLFIRLYRTRGIPGHPLNADFLDAVLRSMAISERDVHWTEWIRQNADGIQKNVQSLENSWRGRSASRSAADHLRAKWLTWVLTTTVLNLRDRVTRALYWFGRGDSAALFELAEHAHDIDDPSIYERTLAASYGVAMALHCDVNQADFRATILPSQACRIFELMFKKNAPGRTTHILTREYGRRFIELALTYHPRLLTPKERLRIFPPYKDGGQIPWQKIRGSKKADTKSASPFRMDFENYTLGGLVQDRQNYDFRHEGYRRVRAQVLWRVGQLGWSEEKFQAIDRSIESSRDRYGRGANEHHKVDRYGKKYSLIAYLELEGWLQDRGLSKERHDYGRTWDVDLDPSFPEPTREFHLVTDDFLGASNLSLADWIKAGPTPDLKPYLQRDSLLEERGPWIALDGYLTQQDELRGRRMFAFVRSFLVTAGAEKKFFALLSKQPMGGRWLPEKPGTLYTFAGEIPWCDTFPESELTEVSFVVRERTVKVKRKKTLYYLDGKMTDFTTIDVMRVRLFGTDPTLGFTSLSRDEISRLVPRNCIVDVDEVQKDIEKFKVVIPIWDFGWEGRNIEESTPNGKVLAKRLAKKANLVSLPQTLDLQTKQGIRATYGVSFNRKDFNNTQGFFYVREDIFREVLDKLRMRLVWAIWGERELSYKQMHRAAPGGDLAGYHHADFQAVYRY